MCGGGSAKKAREFYEESVRAGIGGLSWTQKRCKNDMKNGVIPLCWVKKCCEKYVRGIVIGEEFWYDENIECGSTVSSSEAIQVR